ncbi:MAG: hypothetical protein RL748_1083 [Pseudomonadota bacterium]
MCDGKNLLFLVLKCNILVSSYSQRQVARNVLTQAK